LRIARIFGIDVAIHPSWLFVFALGTWSLSSDIGPLRHLELAQSGRFVIGTLGALLLFCSVLVHELAHSLAARRSGLRVRGITLFLFGGVSNFEDEPASAPSSAWISLVGPLVNFALAAAFFAFVATHALSAPLTTLFRYLAGANVMLGAFNLLPAYPLDGGRVLHALVWRGTGDRMRATIISARVGRCFAALFIAFGIYQTLAAGFGSGLWITFVGWFLLQAGTAEESQALIARSLRGYTVADIASAPGEPLPADATTEEVLAALARSRNAAIPVRLGERSIGVVTYRDIAKLSGSDDTSVYVTALMTRIDDVERIAPGTPAPEAVLRLKQSARSELAVIDADGNLIGFFNQDGIGRWLASRVHRKRRIVAGVATNAGRLEG